MQRLTLVRDSRWRRWPDRLPEQPIFYPVLNCDSAAQIAREWNTKDVEVPERAARASPTRVRAPRSETEHALRAAHEAVGPAR